MDSRQGRGRSTSLRIRADESGLVSVSPGGQGSLAWLGIRSSRDLGPEQQALLRFFKHFIRATKLKLLDYEDSFLPRSLDMPPLPDHLIDRLYLLRGAPRASQAASARHFAPGAVTNGAESDEESSTTPLADAVGTSLGASTPLDTSEGARDAIPAMWSLPLLDSPADLLASGGSTPGSIGDEAVHYDDSEDDITQMALVLLRRSMSYGFSSLRDLAILTPAQVSHWASKLGIDREGDRAQLKFAVRDIPLRLAYTFDPAAALTQQARSTTFSTAQRQSRAATVSLMPGRGSFGVDSGSGAPLIASTLTEVSSATRPASASVASTLGAPSASPLAPGRAIAEKTALSLPAGERRLRAAAKSALVSTTAVAALSEAFSISPIIVSTTSSPDNPLPEVNHQNASESLAAMGIPIKNTMFPALDSPVYFYNQTARMRSVAKQALVEESKADLLHLTDPNLASPGNLPGEPAKSPISIAMLQPRRIPTDPLSFGFDGEISESIHDSVPPPEDASNASRVQAPSDSTRSQPPSPLPAESPTVSASVPGSTTPAADDPAPNRTRRESSDKSRSWLPAVSFARTLPWIPDATRPCCALCLTNFDRFRRRHHCRICGDVVCDSCSPQRVVLPFTVNKIRACLVCTKEVNSFLPKLAEYYQLIVNSQAADALSFYQLSLERAGIVPGRPASSTGAQSSMIPVPPLQAAAALTPLAFIALCHWPEHRALVRYYLWNNIPSRAVTGLLKTVMFRHPSFYPPTPPLVPQIATPIAVNKVLEPLELSLSQDSKSQQPAAPSSEATPASRATPEDGAKAVTPREGSQETAPSPSAPSPATPPPPPRSRRSPTINIPLTPETFTLCPFRPLLWRTLAGTSRIISSRPGLYRELVEIAERVDAYTIPPHILQALPVRGRGSVASTDQGVDTTEAELLKSIDWPWPGISVRDLHGIKTALAMIKRDVPRSMASAGLMMLFDMKSGPDSATGEAYAEWLMQTPQLAGLSRILCAYSVYPERHASYCQGMNYIACLILAVLKGDLTLTRDEDREEHAFWLFVYALEGCGLGGLYSADSPTLVHAMRTFDSTLQAHMPNFAEFLSAAGLSSSMLSCEFLTTGFVYVLSFETVVQVWDLFLFEGIELLFLLGVSLLSNVAHVLETCRSADEVLPALRRAGKHVTYKDLIGKLLQLVGAESPVLPPGLPDLDTTELSTPSISDVATDTNHSSQMDAVAKRRPLELDLGKVRYIAEPLSKDERSIIMGTGATIPSSTAPQIPTLMSSSACWPDRIAIGTIDAKRVFYKLAPNLLTAQQRTELVQKYLWKVEQQKKLPFSNIKSNHGDGGVDVWGHGPVPRVSPSVAALQAEQHQQKECTIA